MTSNFPPFALAFLINTLLTLTLAVVAVQRRRSPGALPFAVMMACTAAWSFTQFFESGALTVPDRIYWSKLQYIGLVNLPAAWLWFSLRYVRSPWLPGPRVLVLWLLPLITLDLAWTNESHLLIWPQVTLYTAPFPMAVYHHGFWFWVNAAYSYVMVITGTLLLLRESLFAPRLHQRQTVVLISGALAPLLANLIYVLQLSPIPGLDLTSLAFTFTGLLYLPMLYRLRILDLTPVARGMVVEQLSDAMIVLDTQGRIVDTNPAVGRLLGRDTGAWIGVPLAQALAPYPDLLPLLGTPAPSIITLGGAMARVLDVRRTAISQGAQLAGTLILLRDITEVRAAEQAAFDLALEHERVHLLSRFIRDASHEFRTPLTVINTSLYLLDRSPDPALQASQREKISTQVDRLNALLDDMLTMSRLDEHEPLSLSDVDVNALVQDVALGKAANDVQVELALAGSLPPVRGDASQLRRAILNLFENAVAHTCPGGQVDISTRERDGYALIQVRDTGGGMDAATQQRIFERFFRSDDAHSSPGFGLGLPMARAIVEAHGGLIEVQSALGQGTTFTVQLPLAANPAAELTGIPADALPDAVSPQPVETP